MMNATECIKGRRSIRKFKSDKISHSLLESIISNSSFSPSWFTSESSSDPKSKSASNTSVFLITFFNALRAVPDFLTEPDIRSDFMKNLLVGYALTFIGSASYIKKSYKDANFKIKAEEVEL